MAFKIYNLSNYLKVPLRNEYKVHKPSISPFGAKNYSNKPTDVMPKNVLEPVITGHHQESNGVIYDKKPFKIHLEAGKKYSWCLCGKSKNQPFCDGTHKDVFLKIKHRPVRFVVEESKEYWLCNCKQTANRPFCDGTHKTKVVLEGTSTVRQ